MYQNGVKPATVWNRNLSPSSPSVPTAGDARGYLRVVGHQPQGISRADDIIKEGIDRHVGGIGEKGPAQGRRVPDEPEAMLELGPEAAEHVADARHGAEELGLLQVSQP